MTDPPERDSTTPKFLTTMVQPLCFLGGFLTILGLGGTCVALFADIFDSQVRPYQAIFTFVLFPAVMLTGLLLFFIGLRLHRRRLREGPRKKAKRGAFLDLARPIDRFILAVMFLLACGVGLATIVGSYHAYEYTESKEFCGELCHVPMRPESVAHSNSPHANVPCVDCHVGPRVNDYVKAKLSGMRQVYQLARNSFHRPIHAPASRILPSQLVCEGCHWPQMYFGLELDNRVRYGYDLGNSKRQLHLMLRAGGGGQRGQNHSGNIHWHTTEGGALTFRALDERKQEIVRITATREDGRKRVYDLYEDGQRKHTDQEIEELPSHEMECLDCHNRPAHRFLTPDDAIDRAFENRVIDPSIPFLKRVAIKALAADYPTTEAALAGIRKELTEYYSEGFNGTVLDRKEQIEAAIEGVQAIYQRNIFPEMKVNWETYPDNIGHRTSPGCFRCHGDKHQTSDGIVLDHECKKCHVFFQQERGSRSLLEAPGDASFVHPFTHEKHYTEIDCWDCHKGASSPYSECQRCHEEQMQSEKMTFSCSVCHRPGDPQVSVSSCGPCHPTLDSKLHTHKDHGDCLSCHKPHLWEVTDHSSCSPCHEAAQVAKWGDHLPDGECRVGAGFQGVRASMWGLYLSERARAEASVPRAGGDQTKSAE
jgi:nitrate/TMAO reductase-like tetraheme cytochrome c subunit